MLTTPNNLVARRPIVAAAHHEMPAILVGEMGHYFRDQIVARATWLAQSGYSTRKAAAELTRLFPGEDTPSHPTLVQWRKEPTNESTEADLGVRVVEGEIVDKITPGVYRQFPRDFDQATYRRALELIEEYVNVARAHRMLRIELEAKGKPVPSYATCYTWAEKSKGMLGKLRADKTEEIIAVSGEVALAMSDALLESQYEEISPSQLAILYGIAMQRRTEWDKTGRGSGKQVNVQFNFYSDDDKD